jgi:hypothetical protein
MSNQVYPQDVSQQPGIMVQPQPAGMVVIAPAPQVMVQAYPTSMADIIAGQKGLYIEEWPTLIPAQGCSASCCKHIGTKYIAYPAGTRMENKGPALFTATERSDCCEKICCDGNHGFTLEVRPGDYPDGWIFAGPDPRPVINTIERKGCCSGKQCLMCPAFINPCINELSVYDSTVPPSAQAGEINAVPLFTSSQASGCAAPFCPVINAAAPGQPPAMNMKGPMCFGGCLGLCVGTKFLAADGQGPLGSVERVAPENCLAMCCRCATEYDQFRIDFTDTATADQKMAMTTGAFLADVFMFNKDKSLCECKGQALRINLFNMYCCGSIVPCYLYLQAKG